MSVPAANMQTQAARALPLLLGSALVLGFLYFAKPVVIPLALAILFTFLLAPFSNWLEKLGLGRAVSVSLVSLLALALVLGTLFGVTRQIGGLLDEYPKYQQNVTAKIAQLRQGARNGPLAKLQAVVDQVSRQIDDKRQRDMSDAEKELAQAQRVRVVQEGALSLRQLAGIAGNVLEPIAQFGLVFVLVVFMLAGREDLRDRVISLVGADRLAGTTRALQDAGERVSRYLLMQLLVNTGYGLAVGAGLWLIGVPYAPLWGFFAALLRYIPYLGPWLAALLPITLSLLIAREWSVGLKVVALFGVLELITNMLVEPMVYGRGIGVSQAALLVAVAFWTWLWGPVGLVLASPLTVCLVVLGRYVPYLSFLDTLLGDRPALTPAQRLYQRLLARDEDEAGDLLEERIDEASMVAAFDDTLLPTLALAREDLRKGRIDADTQRQVVELVRELIEEDVAPQAAAAPGDGAEQPRYIRSEVLALPAHDATDELALAMLGRVVDPRRFDWQVTSSTRLAADLVALVEAAQPDLVFIASVPPGGLAHTRYLCKRLRARFPYLRIVVGRFGLYPQDVEDNRRQLRDVGADQVVTRVDEVVAALQKVASLDPVPAMDGHPAR